MLSDSDRTQQGLRSAYRGTTLPGLTRILQEGTLKPSGNRAEPMAYLSPHYDVARFYPELDANTGTWCTFPDGTVRETKSVVHCAVPRRSVWKGGCTKTQRHQWGFKDTTKILIEGVWIMCLGPKPLSTSRAITANLKKKRAGKKSLTRRKPHSGSLTKQVSDGLTNTSPGMPRPHAAQIEPGSAGESASACVVFRQLPQVPRPLHCSRLGVARHVQTPGIFKGGPRAALAAMEIVHPQNLFPLAWRECFGGCPSEPSLRRCHLACVLPCMEGWKRGGGRAAAGK